MEKVFLTYDETKEQVIEYHVLYDPSFEGRGSKTEKEVGKDSKRTRNHQRGRVRKRKIKP